MVLGCMILDLRLTGLRLEAAKRLMRLRAASWLWEDLALMLQVACAFSKVLERIGA